MSAPYVSIVTAAQAAGPQACCSKCNLSAPDDGFRRKKHGGKVFLCLRCR